MLRLRLPLPVNAVTWLSRTSRNIIATVIVPITLELTTPACATTAPRSIDVIHRFANCAEAEAFWRGPEGRRVGHISYGIGYKSNATTDGRDFTVHVSYYLADVRIELPSWSWPDETVAETLELKSFRGAVTTHETGHYLLAVRFIKQQHLKIKVRRNGIHDVPALLHQERKVVTDRLAAIENAYDVATAHGTRQSDASLFHLRSGPDVAFECPTG